jgi:malate dehydrogenase (oxaloacetate-decarboxylating)
MPDKLVRLVRELFATGRSDYPNQVNNSLVFPGLFRGALDAGISKFNQKMFVGIAQALAECVVDLSPNKILPTVFEPNVVTAVAEAVKRYK